MLLIKVDAVQKNSVYWIKLQTMISWSSLMHREMSPLLPCRLFLPVPYEAKFLLPKAMSSMERHTENSPAAARVPFANPG